MKKSKTSKEHISKEKNVKIDKKQSVIFNNYMTEVLKIVLMNNNNQMLSCMFKYLEKLTENNPYYSRMLMEFLLSSSEVDK